MKKRLILVLPAAGLWLLAGAAPARAHCDTLDGPVVKDAQAALAAGEVTPVLKWVGPDAEGAVREAFRSALAVRALGPEGRALADRFFFETVVRLHREGEGAPYTGLKPPGTAVEPGVAASDKALETGSADGLVAMLTAEVERGLRQRFAAANTSRGRAGESLDRGREFVAAYVELVHYAEGLHAAAAAPPGRHGEAAGGAHRH